MKLPNQLECKAQLQRLRARYARRNKAGKARMLDEFCAQHRSHRKPAIKLLGDALPKPTGQSPPGPEPQSLPGRAPARFAAQTDSHRR